MNNSMTVYINGQPLVVAAGTSAAAALAIAGIDATHFSVTGMPRGPVCGMGICFECSATIDGRPRQRTCQIVCRPKMEIRTDDKV